MTVDSRVVSRTGRRSSGSRFPGSGTTSAASTWRRHLHRLYANTLTPVEMRPGHVWEATDLFLDVWLDERGGVVLDEDELEDALRADGSTTPPRRLRAREVDDIL
jgi:predicted RNA-binding protein associated with RNAse of E/G family